MKFLDTLKALGLPRQIALAAAVLAIVLAMSFMVRGATKDPMTLLYSGLGAEQAGEIIEELEKRGIKYEVKGEAIFIPQTERDATRLALARDGLPRQSVQGYELLDDVNGFSVTSEMYNAAYWRAREGELTRTILAIPGIEAARVHIGASLRSGFARTQAAPTASVTLSTVHDLSAEQAEAIQYLVALAVSGLKPDDVAVIDSRKGIIAGPSAKAAETPAIEAGSQAALIEQRLLRLLEARVGQGNAQVSVAVDVTRERETISTISFDPQSRVVRNRTTNEQTESNTSNAGAVTVASNLPQEAPAESAGGSSSKASGETVAYEINETRTATEKLPGGIEKISVAVLLSEQALGLDPAATDAAEKKTQLIKELTALIQPAAGIDTSRGDTLSVEIMPFQPPKVEELTPKPSLMQQLAERYAWPGAQALLLALVVIVLALGVVRPMLMRRTEDPALDADATGNDAAAEPESADPITYLNTYARERQEDAALLLESWLKEDRKAAANE